MTAPDIPGDLLALAREDLAVARTLDANEGISNAQSGFHAQQAVEKALKAVLAKHGVEFPYTHNIGLLMRLCEDQGYELPAQLLESDRLTPYAAAIRYGLGDPATVAPADAIRWATLAVEWAESQVSTDSP
jgi:HEPN domain-containing protein